MTTTATARDHHYEVDGMTEEEVIVAAYRSGVKAVLDFDTLTVTGTDDEVTRFFGQLDGDDD